MDKVHLHVDAQYIKLRKKTHKTKLEAVFDYLARFECRSVQLLAYFDENQSTTCGSCDVCLRKNRKSIPDSEFLDDLKSVLTAGSLSLNELIDTLTLGDEDQRLQFVRKCLDQGILVEKEGRYSV